MGHLQELKNKGKVQLNNPKSGRGRGRLRERSLTGAFHYKVLRSSSNGVLQIKMVVTRAGCLQEWSQGELQLYLLPISGFPCNINANKDTVYELNDVWMYRVNPDKL